MDTFRRQTQLSKRLEDLERCVLPLLQGYLSHKKTPPPIGIAYGPRLGHTVGSEGKAFSFERGTPVQCHLTIRNHKQKRTLHYACA